MPCPFSVRCDSLFVDAHPLDTTMKELPSLVSFPVLFCVLSMTLLLLLLLSMTLLLPLLQPMLVLLLFLSLMSLLVLSLSC